MNIQHNVKTCAVQIKLKSGKTFKKSFIGKGSIGYISYIFYKRYMNTNVTTAENMAESFIRSFIYSGMTNIDGKILLYKDVDEIEIIDMQDHIAPLQEVNVDF